MNHAGELRKRVPLIIADVHLPPNVLAGEEAESELCH